MSRLRIGHKPEDWRDQGESYARLQGIRGSLVVPIPDWRQIERAKKPVSVLTANQRGEGK